MKVGSLVECVNNSTSNKEKYAEMGAIYPMIKIPYTVREIRELTILLEEIDNSHLIPYSQSNREPGFDIKRFRELLPPMEAEIKELLTQRELQPK